MFERLPLKDIHLPEPVSWWPPAVGWWLLPVVVVLLGVLVWTLTITARRMLARRRLRKQALGELKQIRRELDTGGEAARAMERLSVLLRRVAVTALPGRGVAGCVGRDRVDWLRRTGPAGLDSDSLEALIEVPYRPASGVAPQQVFDAAARWIRYVTSRPS